MRNILLIAIILASSCIAGIHDEFGGYVEAPKGGKFLRIITASRRIQMIDAMFLSEQIRHLAHLPTVLEPAENGDGLMEIEQWRSNSRTGCMIILADKVSDGEIISMREKGVSVIVNMASLAADNPENGILISRTKKAIWIAIGNLFGKSVFATEGKNIKSIDSIKSEDPQFEDILAITRLAVERGMTPLGRFSYRSACMQGWAPLPTNKTQRILWERAKDPTARWKQDFGSNHN